MRYYETLYIVHPDYEEERLINVKQSVDRWISDRGASIINSYVWGKRKLAYPVDKQMYGTYMLLNYGTEKPFFPELNEWFQLNEAVLAYFTVLLDQEPGARAEES
ncbi:MAG: 30S ribosomal protein S6 [Candidatus Neomarinimicrobiota bacterium]